MYSYAAVHGDARAYNRRSPRRRKTSSAYSPLARSSSRAVPVSPKGSSQSPESYTSADALDGAAVDRQGRLFWLKSENRRLQNELEGLLDEESGKVVPDAMTAKIESLRDASEALKRQKTKLSETVLPQQTKDIAVLEQRLAQMQADYTHNRAALHEIESHTKVLSDRVVAKECAAAQRQVAVDASRAIRDDIQGALDTLNVRVSELQDEATAMNSAEADEWAELPDEASVPIEQYLALKDECEELHTRLVEHCRAVNTARPAR
eukprot:TRINITY_DN16982_c0_g1_i1.p1 TRINITY_DN16982_c0_g1~~TRINITY_DN16982_c0_g1_i1.p1  ORF type:complete len:264 (+),score=34.55 TRINITY_DN16982_c0_g1_i1:89-880(+)